jgi:hypothetical protein
MSYLLVGMVVAYVLVTIGLVTVLLYYGSLAYQCDGLVGFWCHTDWKCADVNGNNSGVTPLGTPSPIGYTNGVIDSLAVTEEVGIGTYNASGVLVPGDKIGCHLKAMYGIDVSTDPDCVDNAYPARQTNPCMVMKPGETDRNDPNSYTGEVLPQAYACQPGDPNYVKETGLCEGNYNKIPQAGGINNIIDGPTVINQSDAQGSLNAQYGLGNSPPVNDPFGCACYFGTNVIANSGSGTAVNGFDGDDGGGVYNISGNACSQIMTVYAPKK